MIRPLASCALLLASLVSVQSAPIADMRPRVDAPASFAEHITTSDEPRSFTRVGWFSSDPVAHRTYDAATLRTLEVTKQAQVRGTDAFVIEDGYVFYIDFKNPPKYVDGSSDVRQLVLFKGKLIALDKDHDVYILTESEGPSTGSWYELGNSAVSIETDGVDLFALTESRGWFTREVTRGVWVYKGQPGEVTWTLVPMSMPMPCGNSTCIQTFFIPAPAGREVAFTDANVPGAVAFIKSDGKLFARTADGRQVQISRP